MYSGFLNNMPDDDLLSHWLQHYHRRKVVSRSCSGWEGVVPTRYVHQANLSAIFIQDKNNSVW